MEKKCSKCFIYRKYNEFPKDNSRNSGLMSQCKYCRAIIKKKWYKEHKKRANIRHRKYQHKRLQKDINFKLIHTLRSRLNKAIKGNYKVGSAVEDLGCSIDFLKQYIESKFHDCMTWGNWGRGLGKWNIDHIIPLSSFDLIDREQLLKAVHYTNLQPLWWIDNCEKGVKIL